MTIKSNEGKRRGEGHVRPHRHAMSFAVASRRARRRQDRRLRRSTAIVKALEEIK